MRCTYCGEENPNEAKFCQKCGAELPEAPAQDDAKKNILKRLPKKAIIGVAVCIALVIVAALAVKIIGSKPAYPANSVTTFFDYEEGQTLIMVNNKLLSTKIEGNAGTVVGDFSAKNFVANTSEDELYLISGDKMAKIAEDVDSYAFSADGSAIAYVNNDIALMLYSVSGGKATKIADDVEDELAISPDGKSLLYTIENDDYDIELFLYDSGKSASLGKELSPVAVSNGAKYSYFVNEDDSFYVCQKGKEKVKLAENVQRGAMINKDGTEIIFFTDDGKSYVSVKGEEKMRLSNSEIMYELKPYHTSRFCGGGNGSVAYAVNSGSLLNNTYVSNGGDVIKVNGKGESDRVLSDVEIELSDNGKTITYLKDDSIFRGKLSKPSEAKKIIEEDADYLVTSDSNSFYYLTDDFELIFKKGNSNPKKISDDVFTSSAAVNRDGTLFFIEDYSSSTGGTLYYTSGGKEKVKIADDVVSVRANANAVYYNTVIDSDTVSVFASDGGTKFTKVADISNALSAY